MTDTLKITEEAWVKLTRTQTYVMCKIETALKEASLPSLSWYDVLIELERVEQDGLRPFELQEKLLLPQYGISRLINRIEEAGYLQKHNCNEDGRGLVLFITKSGKAIRKKMWEIYGPAIEQAFGKKLSKKELEQLIILSGKVMDHTYAENE